MNSKMKAQVFAFNFLERVEAVSAKVEQTKDGKVWTAMGGASPVASEIWVRTDYPSYNWTWTYGYGGQVYADNTIYTDSIMDGGTVD